MSVNENVNINYKEIFGVLWRSLINHFTGKDAITNWRRFFVYSLTRSTAVTLVIMMLAAWALFAWLIYGPDHEYYLTEFHKQIISLDTQTVIKLANQYAINIFYFAVEWGLIIGVFSSLLSITKEDMDNYHKQHISKISHA